MNSEQRVTFARQLRRNKLLAELLEGRIAQLHERWEAADTRDEREGLWHQVQATLELRDYINGRIEQLAGRDD